MGDLGEPDLPQQEAPAGEAVGSHENLRENGAGAQFEDSRPGHPLLKTWNPPRNHTFTEAQMRALSSICDTLSPSIDDPHLASEPRNQNGHHDDAHDAPPRMSELEVEDMAAFYRCSASDLGVPADIAGLLSVLLKPKLLKAIWVFLWLLSTRLGTVILGGRASISRQFPFFQSFAFLPRAQQEKVIRQWSLSSFSLFRAVYKLFKMITMWAVYTKIDRHGHNRNWKAIGYCGPDPEVFGDKKRSSESQSAKNPADSLKEYVIETQAGGRTLVKALEHAGVPVLDDIRHLQELVRSGRLASETKHAASKVSPRGTTAPDIGITCDVVVLGSGCGGGVVASVLAKAGYKVIVLEKGKSFTTDDLTAFEGPTQMAMYEKLGSLATDDGGVNLVAGATVGGGTIINWSVCFETPPHVLQEWATSTGVALFTSARYQDAMHEVWRRLGAQPDVRRENFPNSVLRAGCQNLNTEVGTLARNASPDHHCGWCTYGCPRGEKRSAAATWLLDAARSGNALVLSECEAQAVLYSSGLPGKKSKQARGVVAKFANGPGRLFVESRATVVASGSLMTPPLLLNSGLRNPNIGKGLHLHPVVFMWGYFPEGCGPSGTCYEGAIMTAYSPLYTRRSPFPTALLEVASTHPGSFATFQPWTSGADFKDRMSHFSRTATFCVVTRDEGSGRVGVEADGTPTFAYRLSAADEETALAGLEKGLRVLIAAGAVEIGTHQQDGERFRVQGASASDIEAYLARVRSRGVKKLQISMGSGHQMGSCKMGSDPKNSVVDPQGESWEVQGLFLGDASVLPSAVGVNPMVTIQSLALCTAHSILQFLRAH